MGALRYPESMNNPYRLSFRGIRKVEIMEKRILVVGATGLLGAPVARQLKHSGFAVRLLVRDVRKAAKHFGGGPEKNFLKAGKPKSGGTRTGSPDRQPRCRI